MKNILYRLFEHQNLSKEEACILLHQIAEKKYTEVQVASLMTVFLMRNISLEELIGFRMALLELSYPISFAEYKPIDIVGTGGDSKNTFNISTCACFVVAGAGYPVVKHGNFSSSSVSGASDVMLQQGVKFTKDISQLCKTMEKCHFVYLHAPLFNSALKAVVGVRKNLGVRSFFNMLGPLVSPAQPTYQLLGVYNLALQRLYSYIYQINHISFAVVYSLDGFDEISLTSDFKITMNTQEKIYSPKDIGFQQYEEEALFGGNTPQEAALIFNNVLKNTTTEAKKNCVLANAGFAIKTICPQKTIQQCIVEATDSLEGGKAYNIFQKFLELNN
ncbi:MAG: anthranilate phosphoribosyltransferase [Chitinophagaceae bacterium]